MSARDGCRRVVVLQRERAQLVLEERLSVVVAYSDDLGCLAEPVRWDESEDDFELVVLETARIDEAIVRDVERIVLEARAPAAEVDASRLIPSQISWSRDLGGVGLAVEYVERDLATLAG